MISPVDADAVVGKALSPFCKRSRFSSFDPEIIYLLQCSHLLYLIWRFDANSVIGEACSPFCWRSHFSSFDPEIVYTLQCSHLF